MSDEQHGTIARLASQRTMYRDAARTAVRENKGLKAQLDELTKKLDAAAKGDQTGRVKDLEGQLRTLRHRSAFNSAARTRGVADEDLDDLFALSGYKADSDEPDERAIGRLLDDAKGHPSRKRYFAAKSPKGGEGDEGDEGDEGGNAGAQGGDEGDGKGGPARNSGREEITPGQPRRSPDAGRGARSAPEGRVILTADQLADPRFMLDPRNKDTIKNARVRM